MFLGLLVNEFASFLPRPTFAETLFFTGPVRLAPKVPASLDLGRLRTGRLLIQYADADLSDRRQVLMPDRRTIHRVLA